MLITFKMSPFMLFLALIISSGAFSQSKFDQGYEAARAGNYQRAVALWQPLAEKGDASAQYTLGWMFESGQGVKQSYQQAILWYRKAANQGDVAAQYVLGTMYKKGTGVTQDSQQALAWFLKAAHQGDAIAQFEVGVHFQQGLGVEQDSQQGLSWFLKAAEQGHITSQINIGKIYQSGKTIETDYQEAIKWYQKAAQQSSALGQYHLAYMYENGLGVKQDLKQAKIFYQLSSNNHYLLAANKVAEFYELGKGGELSLKQALTWYKKAASKGNRDAQFKVANLLYRAGEGAEKDIRSAIRWYTQAANQGHVLAHYQLAMLYKEGLKNDEEKQIIEVNYQNALFHFQEASTLGYPAAHAQLAYLYEEGLGTKVDLIKAQAFYQQSSEPWAIKRYQLLTQQLHCNDNASTELFSVYINCTTREILRKKIKQQKITAIDENDKHWSDTYFTGAVIHGTSELQVTYTRNNFFVSAEYTFIGRNHPELISQVKDQFVERYGQPVQQTGLEEGKAISFKWIMDDNIHLVVRRSWPDTTTFVYYFSPEKKMLFDEQQALSPDKILIPQEHVVNDNTENHLF